MVGLGSACRYDFSRVSPSQHFLLLFFLSFPPTTKPRDPSRTHLVWASQQPYRPSRNSLLLFIVSTTTRSTLYPSSRTPQNCGLAVSVPEAIVKFTTSHHLTFGLASTLSHQTVPPITVATFHPPYSCFDEPLPSTRRRSSPKRSSRAAQQSRIAPPTPTNIVEVVSLYYLDNRLSLSLYLSQLNCTALFSLFKTNQPCTSFVLSICPYQKSQTASTELRLPRIIRGLSSSRCLSSLSRSRVSLYLEKKAPPRSVRTNSSVLSILSHFYFPFFAVLYLLLFSSFFFFSISNLGFPFLVLHFFSPHSIFLLSHCSSSSSFPRDYIMESLAVGVEDGASISCTSIFGPNLDLNTVSVDTATASGIS